MDLQKIFTDHGPVWRYFIEDSGRPGEYGIEGLTYLPRVVDQGEGWAHVVCITVDRIDSVPEFLLLLPPSSKSVDNGAVLTFTDRAGRKVLFSTVTVTPAHVARAEEWNRSHQFVDST